MGAAAVLGLAIVLLLAAALVVLLTTYNSVVAMQRRIDKAWANVDVVLKQRHDELPNLVEAVRGVMAYERRVFEGRDGVASSGFLSGDRRRAGAGIRDGGRAGRRVELSPTAPVSGLEVGGAGRRT